MTVTATATGMHHDALLYADDAEFTRGVAGFIRSGLRAGELPVVAEPPRQIELLRAELGSDADSVRFLDMTQLGGNPARIIPVWQALLEECAGRGVRLRGVGEPAWVGRRANELIECRIHEQLLNVAFGDGASWELLCPYDRRRLPASVVAGAWHSHPCVVDDDTHHNSDAYYRGDVTDVFSADLDLVPDGADRLTYERGDVARVRAAVRTFAQASGLIDGRVDDLVLAADELATNSVRHGGGSGMIATWVRPDAVLVEFRDAGTITAPLVGRVRPGVRSYGGRGIFLVNHLCDLVQIRSGAAGTRVRVTMWR